MQRSTPIRFMGLLLAAMSCVTWGGCSKGEPQTDLPIGQELSSVPGVSIRRQPGVTSYTSWTKNLDSGGLAAENLGLFDVVGKVCPLDCLMFDDAPLPKGLFNVSVAADKEEECWRLLKAAYEKAFSVKFCVVAEPTDVFLLVRNEKMPLALATPAPGTSPRYFTTQTPHGFGYRFENSSLDELVRIIEKYVDVPVYNETGIEGGYDFELAMDHWTPETVYPAVERLGLRLEKVQRTLDVLRIKKAE